VVGLMVQLAFAMAVHADPAPSLPMAPLRVVADAAGGGVVHWTRDAGPAVLLGWHVERQEPDGRVVRVNSTRVAAGLLDEPSAVYQVRDEALPARIGETATYRLVVVDPELREWPTAFDRYVVESGPVAVPPPAPKADRSRPAPGKQVVLAGTGTRLRITVAGDGIYRVTAKQIAASLTGYDEARAAQAIAQGQFALSCGGSTVAWRAEAGGTALQFFGQAYRDTYVHGNVYFLAPGAGLAMERINRDTAAVAGDPWFWDTARAEQNVSFSPCIPGGVEDDYFVWTGMQVVQPGVATQWTANVSLPDLHPGMKQGTVTAYLVSAYNGTPVLDNRTRLHAAGQLLDDRTWAGTARLKQAGAATNLTGSQVAVTVELLREANVTTTAILIDALEVRYARRLRALNNQLLFQPEAGTNTVTVRGFSAPAITVLDVTDPLRPVAVAARIAQEGATLWRASWATEAAGSRRYLATAATREPERIEGVRHGGWAAGQAGAPHVVIAPQALAATAQALVNYRTQQGLASQLVPLEEICDDFTQGRRDPRAIPRFLAFAKANWTVPPAYVCLAGDGHLDYHDNFGQSQSRPNHIPPILDRLYQYNPQSGSTQITLGLDNPLADTDGNGVPDMALGRLPAQTPEALTLMIERIKLHEANQSWKKKVLMVSDRDSANAFELACGRLAGRVPAGMEIQQLNHTPATTTVAMRTNFIQAFNSSVPLSIYVGHANNTGLDSSYFFMHNYAQSFMGTLTNRAQTSLFLAGACMVNDFAQPFPTSRCIGKGFLDSAPGGAIAVWGTATENTLPNAESGIAAILDELFKDHDARLGDLIRSALNVQARSVMPWMVRASVLMGDPGTRIRTHLVEELAIQPAALALPSAAVAGGPITVAAAGAWTAAARSTWITITEGAAGSGNGQVRFQVAENTGAARTGSIVVTADGVTKTCRVEQAAALVSIVTEAQPFTGGSVSNPGPCPVGQQVRIAAVANAGWWFTGWSDGSTQNPRWITVPAGGATFTATFSQQPVASLINVEASPLAGGTVSGGGAYPAGGQAEIAAAAQEGWAFAGWSDGSTQNPRTIQVPFGGQAFTARFTPVSVVWPAGDVILEAGRPLFAWPATAGATWYQVWINRNGKKWMDRWIQAAANWTPAEDLNGGEYQWWVRSWGAGMGMGPWSEAARFSIPMQVPGQLVQDCPQGIQTSCNLTYRWQKDARADWYQLWVSRIGAGGWHNRWFEMGGEGAAAATPGDALPGPARPVPSAPAGEIENGRPTFEWTGGWCEWWLRGWGMDGFGPWAGPVEFRVPQPSNTWYRVYVNQGNQNVLDQWVQDPRLEVADDLPSGAYAWWIGAWDAQARRTIWSPRLDFTVPEG
jgi:hypothetical protein